jgi:hypothetical protein
MRRRDGTWHEPFHGTRHLALSTYRQRHTKSVSIFCSLPKLSHRLCTFWAALHYVSSNANCPVWNPLLIREATSYSCAQSFNVHLHWLVLSKLHQFVFICAWSDSAFEAEARLNNIDEFNSYLTENITLHHYRDQVVNAVYSENHSEPINIKRKSYLMLKRLVHIDNIRL